MDYYDIHRVFQEKPDYRRVLGDMIIIQQSTVAGNSLLAVPKWTYLNDSKLFLNPMHTLYPFNLDRVPRSERKEAVEFLKDVGFIKEVDGPGYPDGYRITFLTTNSNILSRYIEWEKAYTPTAIRLGEKIEYAF